MSGHITPGGLNYLCRRLDVPPAEVYGVASFYALIATEPRASAVAHICDDIACRVNGAGALCSEMQRRLGPPGQGGGATWLSSPCLGLCERAPAALVQRAGLSPDEVPLAPASPETIISLLDREPTGPPAGALSAPQTVDPDQQSNLRLLGRAGRTSPESLSAYRASGGYAAFATALRQGPEGVIHVLTASGLLGRGGAAFPAGRKWEAVATAPDHPHYLVCNADESEPGTFKDRVLMEEDPFALVEAMTIAAYATGCEHGYLYIRGEYPRAFARMDRAVRDAAAAGLLGDNVMGSGFRFDIELRRGGGAYICGEETALFSSIEGRRGEPRSKPPFPTQSGLFGKPTLVNNVETLLNVPHILLGSPGPETKLFALSGCVARPGVYEVPLGTPLRDLLNLAGGVRGGRSLQAVLLGGAAGTFLTPDQLDLALDFESTRAAGATLGSGAVLVFDGSVDLAGILLRIAGFFRHESCGQCVPCRVGTVRLEEAVHRLAAGRPLGSLQRELTLIGDVSRAMRDASICGLGQTAPSAIESAIGSGLFAATRRSQ